MGKRPNVFERDEQMAVLATTFKRLCQALATDAQDFVDDPASKRAFEEINSEHDIGDCSWIAVRALRGEHDIKSLRPHKTCFGSCLEIQDLHLYLMDEGKPAKRKTWYVESEINDPRKFAINVNFVFCQGYRCEYAFSGIYIDCLNYAEGPDFNEYISPFYYGDVYTAEDRPDAPYNCDEIKDRLEDAEFRGFPKDLFEKVIETIDGISQSIENRIGGPTNGVTF